MAWLTVDAFLPPGCVQCRMRRIRCDKEEPECFKCRKKGICCSGQGIEYRFSSHMTVACPSKNGALKVNNNVVQPTSRGKPARRPFRRPTPSLSEGDVQSPETGKSSAHGRAPARRLSGKSPVQAQHLAQIPLPQGPFAILVAHPPHDGEHGSAAQDRDNAAGNAALISLRGPLESVTSRSRMFFDHCMLPIYHPHAPSLPL